MPGSSMNIDRANRNQLADAILDYLGGNATAFQFDERIFDIQSNDPTVGYVRLALWFHYDDIRDHHVALSKTEWDYFYRLVLLLRSDAQICSERRRHHSFTQIVAAAGLVLFGYCAAVFGFGSQLLIVAVPFGILSAILTLWRRRYNRKPTRRELAMTPFSSVSQIMKVRRSVGGFVKHPYPGDLQENRPWSASFGRVMNGLGCIYWAIGGPAVLFFQIFPIREVRTRVTLP